MLIKSNLYLILGFCIVFISKIMLEITDTIQFCPLFCFCYLFVFWVFFSETRPHYLAWNYLAWNLVCRPSWLRTHSNPPASAFWVQRLKAWVTTAGPPTVLSTLLYITCTESFNYLKSCQVTKEGCHPHDPIICSYKSYKSHNFTELFSVDQKW